MTERPTEKELTLPCKCLAFVEIRNVKEGIYQPVVSISGGLFEPPEIFVLGSYRSFDIACMEADVFLFVITLCKNPKCYMRGRHPEVFEIKEFCNRRMRDYESNFEFVPVPSRKNQKLFVEYNWRKRKWIAFIPWLGYKTKVGECNTKADAAKEVHKAMNKLNGIYVNNNHPEYKKVYRKIIGSELYTLLMLNSAFPGQDTN